MAYHDPVTGDALSFKEHLTRQVQVVVRSPWFIVAFNALTIVAILLGHVDFWNFVMSWLAIIIEWVVGTYMFGQTGRDARYIRRIAHLEEVNEVQLRHLETLLETAGLDPAQTRRSGLHGEAPEVAGGRAAAAPSLPGAVPPDAG